ncbi:MAG: helix-turn-helix transcriptional regulator [Mesorhizobium sp.]|uniref:helix-turn-helix domain-containing protein n=1 Tax=Mesorhizobium sp. TaxID=1871066 RepID=UPI0011FA8942|nr:helix-turn-helix transcriptional regulator [Mesorhizobium sp.]TIV83834.1 MAG: helix-turn-helix transcriptional regulator [Mesorhizobium sp.]
MTHALTRYREAADKLSLEAFGALVGAHKSMVYKWENGTIPRPAFMAKIQEATGGKVTAADWYATASEQESAA